jgi:hypothetical protein
MNRWIKRALFGVSIAAFVLLLGVGSLYWLLRSGCKDTKEQVTISPDGAWKAVAYDRSCGVFTAGSSVYVIPVRRWWPRRSDYVFASEGPVYLSLEWTDSRHLRIFHDRGFAPGHADIITKREEHDSVKIAYTELR